MVGRNCLKVSDLLENCGKVAESIDVFVAKRRHAVENTCWALTVRLGNQHDLECLMKPDSKLAL